MVNPFKLGLVFAIFLALFHACWAALVATGFAQTLIDFIFWIHFIAPVYRVEPFDAARALILIGVTAGVGMVIGFVGGIIWNVFHRRTA